MTQDPDLNLNDYQVDAPDKKASHNRNPTGYRGDYVPPPGEKSTNLNVRCRPTFKELVKAQAKSRKISQDDFLELAVKHFLDSEAKKCKKS